MICEKSVGKVVLFEWALQGESIKTLDSTLVGKLVFRCLNRNVMGSFNFMAKSLDRGLESCNATNN